MEIRGKVALVTGGAHRVGKAITMMLAKNGADVIVNYFSSDKAALDTVAEALMLEAGDRKRASDRLSIFTGFKPPR